jgi:hypothetical protein
MAMSLWLEGTRGELAGTGVVAVGFNTEYHITMARETLPVMNPFDVGFWHKCEVLDFGATIEILMKDVDLAGFAQLVDEIADLAEPDAMLAGAGAGRCGDVKRYGD